MMQLNSWNKVARRQPEEAVTQTGTYKTAAQTDKQGGYSRVFSLQKGWNSLTFPDYD